MASDLRVLVDAHHLGSHATGNETWALGSALALQRRGDLDLTFATSGAGHTQLPGARTVEMPVSSARRLAWDLPRACRDVDVALVQWTAPVTTTPIVTVVHDLSFEDPASAAWIPPRTRPATACRPASPSRGPPSC